MLYLIKFFLICTVLLVPNADFSEKETPESTIETHTDSPKIAWDTKYKLEWKDFEARAQSNSSLDAYTMLGISLEMLGQENGKVDMGIFGYFEKDKSWVKAGEKTDNLLHHERKHFDLCEVYRRKLIKKLEAKKTYSFDNFSKEVGDIFNDMFAKYTAEQERYDHETNHSQDKAAQIKWNKHIAKELLRLKKYDKLAATLTVK